MNYFTMHPNIYSTDTPAGLIQLLEQSWVKDLTPGVGKMYIVSGFANYNGGVRFYDVFSNHIASGGEVIAIFGGSTSQRLSSKQVVEELVNRGVKTYIVNRKRLVHAKLYGSTNDSGDTLIVSSGNFTGPGMTQNVESSIYLDSTTTHASNFIWTELIDNMLSQNWQCFELTQGNISSSPAMNLLYDELTTVPTLDDTESITMVMNLGHSDTARIMANSGTPAFKGSQYFWISKETFGFFPPLTIRNRRGNKTTYSCLINLIYEDLGETDTHCRVTFEAENNFDVRVGTGKLRGTKLASDGDIITLERQSEKTYSLRIHKKDSPLYDKLSEYLLTFIGHRGKKYGFIENSEFHDLINPEAPSE